LLELKILTDANLKMHPSPLQLEHYFVSDLHFSGNSAFVNGKPLELKYDNLSVETSFLKDDKDASKWQVTLRVGHQPNANVNSPYSFIVEIIGFFFALPSYPHDKERLIKTNAPTILYGIAREFVRTVTASGHYHPGVLLPSVSFFEPLPKPAPTATPTGTPTATEPVVPQPLPKTP
jgi:preprotein translocase subunit SecB